MTELQSMALRNCDALSFDDGVRLCPPEGAGAERVATMEWLGMLAFDFPTTDLHPGLLQYVESRLHDRHGSAGIDSCGTLFVTCAMEDGSPASEVRLDLIAAGLLESLHNATLRRIGLRHCDEIAQRPL